MFLLLVATLAVFISSPAQAQQSYDQMLASLYKGTVPTVKPEVLTAELEKNPSIVILDTRTKKEYQVSHLMNSRWVGYEDFDVSRIQGVPRESRIVVYCAVGYRSERVGERLIKAGYTDVRNLYGGIFAWANGGFPLFDEKGQTDRIHAYSRFWGIWVKKGTKVYD